MLHTSKQLISQEEVAKIDLEYIEVKEDMTYQNHNRTVRSCRNKAERNSYPKIPTQGTEERGEHRTVM